VKYISAMALSIGLAAAPAAFAEQQTGGQDAKAPPNAVKMSEAQLDQVAGGLLDVTVSPSNVANPTITVNPTVTANPNVEVHVLGG
jgi:hypothetical protein